MGLLSWFKRKPKLHIPEPEGLPVDADPIEADDVREGDFIIIRSGHEVLVIEKQPVFKGWGFLVEFSNGVKLFIEETNGLYKRHEATTEELDERTRKDIESKVAYEIREVAREADNAFHSDEGASETPALKEEKLRYL